MPRNDNNLDTLPTTTEEFVTNVQVELLKCKRLYYCNFSAIFAHGSAFLQLFLVVRILLRSLGVICYDR